jgi:hypothetical protein
LSSWFLSRPGGAQKFGDGVSGDGGRVACGCRRNNGIRGGGDAVCRHADVTKRAASSASRSVISPSSAFGASNAAAMRRSAADALGALNASTCGSTTACVGAWGKLNMPPSTWQIL